MTSFDWKKNIEDSIKDGLIISIGAIGIFFGLKAAKVKPPKASLDVMDIMKLAGGICGGVLVNDCEVYRKWNFSRYFFNLKQYTTFFYCPTAAVKCVVNARPCVYP